nr:iron ABC transporter permease [Flavobacterium agricola]
MSKKHIAFFILFTFAFVLFLLLNISLGSVTIPFKEIVNALIGNEVSKSTWEYIVLNYRLPKAIACICAGIALSISGLLMQTLFKNPLAEPYVLGISSGASLGVSIVILGVSFLPVFLQEIVLQPYGIVIASSLGSLLVLLLVLAVAKQLKQTMAILVVGLMIGSFTAAFVSVLTYFSSAEQIKKFTFWSLGNLGNLDWLSIKILVICLIIGLLLALQSIKALNSLLLGENYARSLGINFKKTRTIIILATCILTGSVTAFVGPIAFIGLAIAHITKLVFKTSNHFVLYLGCIVLGPSILLLCDTISQMPGFDFMLPINAITSMIGAPIVVWLVLRKNNKIV